MSNALELKVFTYCRPKIMTRLHNKCRARGWWLVDLLHILSILLVSRGIYYIIIMLDPKKEKKYEDK